ncbi:GNAT family N-acetyltransferase [Actinomyces slackii]|uniref:Uncharacterized N-acetyltransferase YjcF n=1 Tax=Actinomyces slackii TaxID=52774 RepID=A0A3S4WLH7_9ACTO|nr:GNAT family N-acetyltransferase [Actinomyces slackii]VEG75523.1 Uncharacterized N-acetyltransferase YjcF [Actinomyces slackii]
MSTESSAASSTASSAGPDQAGRPAPGFPVLRIPPAGAALEPISFEAVAGDAVGPAAEAIRSGLADVRLEVFVKEQGVPFIEEIDAQDDEATTVHVLARGADGAPLAAGRILLDPSHPREAHLGRLAVRRVARGTGLGARMVSELERAALSALATAGEAEREITVILSAQEQAMGFYERCGYTAVSGESYMDAGIPHQDMRRTVTSDPAHPGGTAGLRRPGEPRP